MAKQKTENKDLLTQQFLVGTISSIIATIAFTLISPQVIAGGVIHFPASDATTVFWLTYLILAGLMLGVQAAGFRQVTLGVASIGSLGMTTFVFFGFTGSPGWLFMLLNLWLGSMVMLGLMESKRRYSKK